MSGKTCYQCGQEIGFWSVFKSMWPTRIFCPYCKTKNSYKYGHMIGLAFAVATIPLAYIALVIASLSIQNSNEFLPVYWLVIYLVLLELLLLVTTWSLRRHGQLIIRK